MVKKISGKPHFYLIILFYMALLITSCNSGNPRVDVSGIPVSLQIKRFEKDLFAIDTIRMGNGIELLKKKYGRFFNLYTYAVSGLGSRDSLLMEHRFKDFVSDTNMRAVFLECEKQFGNLQDLETGLTQAFKHYKYYFPGKIIPEIITMVDAFQYPVAVDSMYLAIGLDMYLGTDYKYYFTMDPVLPKFIRNRMRKEYILSDAMKGWLQSDYETDESGLNFLEIIISQGRLVYALDCILPEVEDTLKQGYTAKQLEWCRENEISTWSFFIDQKILFNNDPNIISKYVHDGPTTNGFPKESPGNIGQFTGTRIVQAYMKKNPGVSLRALMETKDLQKIFQESGYKPSKSIFKKSG